MKKQFSVLLTILILSTTSIFAYVGDNDPKFIDPNFDHKFDSLPLASELTLDQTPWSSSFWPNIYGGIAFRWNNFYTEEPPFAPLHSLIETSKKDISKLHKELFDQGTSPNRRIEIINEVNRLKNLMDTTEKVKATFHKQLFFDLERPKTMEDVMKLDPEQMKKLSPAEKYDIFVGDYDFTLTNYVLKKNRPDNEYWEGICNGWSSAAIEFHEPKAQSIKNKDGITVDFGSSDIKALLNFYHDAMTSNPNTSTFSFVGRVGVRCTTSFSKESWFIGSDLKEYYKAVVNGKVYVYYVPDVCVDMNPGAFHIVMANQLGLKNESFVAEMVRDNEVWNQPVYKFESKVLDSTSDRIRKNATPGTVRQLRVATELFYANDGGRMYWGAEDPEDEFYAWWEATNGTENYRSASKKMKYFLDLDKDGKIIGGMWLSYDRPDFIWAKKSKGFIPYSPNYGIVNHMRKLESLVEIRE